MDRPEFRRLLDAIQAGAIDGLIAYHLDRVARDPRDLEDLIDAVESARLPVESVTGSLRLGSDAEITIARVAVAFANQSSRDTSRRIRRKMDDLAEAGRYSGGGARRYGFEVDGVTHKPDEAEVIRWAAAEVLGGRTVSSIVRDLNERRVPPVKADRWSSKSMTDILSGPRIAGLRVHRGEIVGTAAWAPILDRDTWDSVVATLAGRGRGMVQPRLERWLNGLLTCGLCDELLMGAYMTPPRPPRYWCKTGDRYNGCGRIAISAPPAEAEVARQVLDYITGPSMLSALARATAQEGVQRAGRSVAEDEAQLRELARMWAEKVITLAEYVDARRIIEGRLEASRVTARSAIPARLRSVVTDPNVREAWADLAPTVKRDVTRLVLGVNGHRGWKVNPADTDGPRRFQPERLVLAKRTG